MATAMPEFTYKAARRDGSSLTGMVNAKDQSDAYRQLRSQGLTVLRVETGAAAGPASVAGATVERQSVLELTRELSVLLRAGLPIDKALKILIDMTEKPAVSQLLNQLLDTVKRGKSFSEALEPYRSSFGNFYINMARAGEASGSLSQALERLLAYLERSKEVRSSVVSALIYPAILLVVASLSIIIMLGFVVPQFEALFADMGDALPLLTQWVVGLGNWIEQYWFWLLIVLAVGVLLMRHWLKSQSGQYWISRRLLNLPIMGGILFKYEMARFARTMGTLVGNGVSLLQAIGIALETVGNPHVRADLEVLRPTVKQGGRMSQALKDSGSFSPLVVQMVRVGEESGSLDSMLLELADVFDGEVQAGVKRVLTLLEPALILFMGGAIALIIIAILMGILSVNDLAI